MDLRIGRYGISRYDNCWMLYKIGVNKKGVPYKMGHKYHFTLDVALQRLVDNILGDPDSGVTETEVETLQELEELILILREQIDVSLDKLKSELVNSLDPQSIKTLTKAL